MGPERFFPKGPLGWCPIRAHEENAASYLTQAYLTIMNNEIMSICHDCCYVFRCASHCAGLVSSVFGLIDHRESLHTISNWTHRTSTPTSNTSEPFGRRIGNKRWKTPVALVCWLSISHLALISFGHSMLPYPISIETKSTNVDAASTQHTLMELDATRQSGRVQPTVLPAAN